MMEDASVIEKNDEFSFFADEEIAKASFTSSKEEEEEEISAAGKVVEDKTACVGEVAKLLKFA